MAGDRNGTLSEQNSKEESNEPPQSKKHSKSGSRKSSDSDSEEERKRVKRDKGKSKSRKRHHSRSDEDSYSDSDSYSDYSSASSEYSDSESDAESESEEERKRRKRKERKRRRERDEERERKRRKREKEKRRKEKEERKRRKEKRRRKKKEKLERGKKGAVTNSWGKYGIIRETDMWNKRPEFTAWLAEVKKVNLESLPNWEEKQMFKEFMEDHNTATFPSKKYYNLDAYYQHQAEKEMKKGFKKVMQSERTVFNDEEQRRLELLQAREKQKEEEVEVLKCAMRSGMAQAMKEQAQLREEMAYQYKLGNFEAAAAIQRRLDPDIPM